MKRWILSLFLIACTAESPRGPRDASLVTDAATNADAGADTIDAGVGGLQGLELMERLAGLWSGPATRTVLGDFSRINVDFRAASDQFLFGRVDVDEDNALRFGFSIESRGDRDVLVYRNGGYFLGMLRDDRTELIEHDADEASFRFCDVDRGCDYIDAVFDFDGEARLIFDVLVRGQQHVYWDARRLEDRELPPGFVEGLVSQGTGDAPFPPLPSLDAVVSWSQPLANEADVWIVLSATECSVGECNISRHIRTVAAAGATTAVVHLEQVLPGDYRALAVLDRDQNLDRTLAPDSGDGVSIPNQEITIAANGDTTANLIIVVDLP